MEEARSQNRRVLWAFWGVYAVLGFMVPLVQFGLELLLALGVGMMFVCQYLARKRKTSQWAFTVMCASGSFTGASLGMAVVAAARPTQPILLALTVFGCAAILATYALLTIEK